ncbi:MAG: hypothetical protein AMJ79_12615 [Phycisphaerae bacterium SM23_30]|nr:MAG: hypothetical protein AMJ79_12615 [Phycisphaerae bacterium SM23_30]
MAEIPAVSSYLKKKDNQKTGGFKSSSAGGTVVGTWYATTALAYIDEDAEVSAGNDVTLSTESDNFIVSLTQASSEGASELGFYGAIGLTVVTDSTQAYIAKGAAVSEGNDLTISAGDNTWVVNMTKSDISGSIGAANLSAAVNVMNRDTKARLGEYNTDNDATVNISAGGNLSVDADQEQDHWPLQEETQGECKPLARDRRQQGRRGRARKAQVRGAQGRRQGHGTWQRRSEYCFGEEGKHGCQDKEKDA